MTGRVLSLRWEEVDLKPVSVWLVFLFQDTRIKNQSSQMSTSFCAQHEHKCEEQGIYSVVWNVLKARESIDVSQSFIYLLPPFDPDIFFFFGQQKLN